MSNREDEAFDEAFELVQELSDWLADTRDEAWKSYCACRDDKARRDAFYRAADTFDVADRLGDVLTEIGYLWPEEEESEAA